MPAQSYIFLTIQALNGCSSLWRAITISTCMLSLLNIATITRENRNTVFRVASDSHINYCCIDVFQATKTMKNRCKIYMPLVLRSALVMTCIKTSISIQQTWSTQILVFTYFQYLRLPSFRPFQFNRIRNPLQCVTFNQLLHKNLAKVEKLYLNCICSKYNASQDNGRVIENHAYER